MKGKTNKKSSKKKPPAIVVPRLGPPINLRPGGAHADDRDRPRAEAERKAIDESADER